MQAALLRKRTGCSEPDRKAWARQGVLLPHSDGDGPGVHAEYDEANVLVAAILLRMKDAHITVSKYAPAFQVLHQFLRQRSVLEWSLYRVNIVPDQLMSFPVEMAEELPATGFIVNLGAVYADIPGADIGQGSHQLSLPYGLTVV